ncbi:MAG TPA: Zn-ribbon domain-containing OB-fold protein [Actinomycetota bacterium]|nr:Zn-ribbon domain-containing OB-fold protein [Actinomycetota bacterium]
MTVFEKVSDPKDVILWQDRIPIRHRYTPGVAGEAFFTALRDRGELLGSRCESCQITYVPARLFCERCFAGPLEANVTVGPGGTLVSFSVGTVGVEGEPLDEPVTVGLIRPDGADTVLMHFIVDADELEAGMRVEAVLRPEAERTGSILDLRGFRPAS